MTAKETLALWDRAVAAHRKYWRMMDYEGMASDEIRKSDHEASTAFIFATGFSGPDGVALGGEN